MRPACLTVLLLFASGNPGCAALQAQTRAFVDQSAACLHMQQTSPLERLAEPCKYADALATCMELPERLRASIVDECVERRDRLRDEVLPAPTEAAAG